MGLFHNFYLCDMNHTELYKQKYLVNEVRYQVLKKELQLNNTKIPSVHCSLGM